ncbi:TIP120-domain-containing protein [Aureobasidium subglaciale]|nr:TIP120-domain-containing protein [Aureobasidium subglaciale]
MATTAPVIPPNPTAHHVAALLPKLNDNDSDIRYMSLNDLNQMLTIGHPTFISHDYSCCARVVEGLLTTLNDTNGDVQNMAIKCLGPFVNKAPESILCPTFDKISNLRTDNAIDSSIPALAVRAMVVALPRPTPSIPRTQKVNEAYLAISRALIPRLVGHTVIATGKNLPAPPKGMIQIEVETGIDSNAIDVLVEVARCFGSMLQDVEVEALQKVTTEVLDNPRCSTVMKKKAVIALSVLSPYFSDSLLSSVVSHSIESLRQSHLTAAQRRLYLTIFASMAKSIPRKFGPYLRTLAPFVLSPLSEEELDQQNEEAAESDEGRDPQVEEVREAALLALESFLASCGQDMTPYLPELTDSCLRFAKYDPNYAGDEDDEDMEGAESDQDDDFDVDEDFEEETGFDDEDDVSWKVRRGAAKLIHTLIATRGSGDLLDSGILYEKIAPALLSRFQEREESVRLEVLSTLAFLIRKTGEVSSISSHRRISSATGPPVSRKRRRDSSFSSERPQVSLSNGYVSPSTPPPLGGPQVSLSAINPQIVQSCAKLLKSSTVPTKHAVISLLTDMVTAQHGGLSQRIDQVIDPVLDAMKSTGGTSGGASVTNNSLRIESLRLLRVVADTHSSKVIEPYLSKIMPALTVVSREKFSKVSSEAFDTIQVYIKALTPPRSAGSKQQNAAYLQQIYDTVVQRISASDTDTEVRQKAVQSLGLLIGRTSGGLALLSQQSRLSGLQLISERLRNELTRLASVKAIETVAVLAHDSQEFTPDWVRDVSLELGAQLRKSSRMLRGASLAALKRLAANPACRDNLDDETVQKIVQLLLPLILIDQDLHLIGPALVIIGSFANERPQLVLDAEVVRAYCFVTKMDLTGAALDALLGSLETIGKKGAGKNLMKALLGEVGVNGNPELVGQVIGVLLVAGGNSVGVSLADFEAELKTTSDEKRKCLALYILGEAGLRMGPSFPYGPEVFTSFFSNSEKVALAAAVALGRAAAGNVSSYLPQIQSSMSQGKQYLLLHTIKELLQHTAAEIEVIKYSKQLWDNIITASQVEDNKVVGAECIGRLATIDPAAYLPQLQAYLSDPKPTVRGMVISALRYTFSDTDPSYDVYLQPSIVPMLTTMLNETDLNNRRLALTTFNSAAHNKPDLILPHLDTLLPLALKETVINTELIREVSMGPFKHKVDDGLELRKSAYETLYALMETAFSRIPIPAFYDRVQAGVGDEHEIKILCCLMLTKLVTLAPEETVRRLESLAASFRAVLAFKPKDTAVKQELEKLGEHNKAIAKVSVIINKTLPAETTADHVRAWADYWDWARKDMAVVVKGAEDELKEKDR